MSIFYRRLPKLDYVKPRQMDEALRILGENQDGRIRLYAGGTDVIPKIKERLMPVPEVLVDLKGITELNYITHNDKEGLHIGALASISQVAQASVIKEKYAMLREAALSIASTQVQNRGTIAGNICNAVPSADSAPALLCLGAKVLCVGKNGERTVDLDDFFFGPGKTALAEDELLKDISIPNLDGKGAYIKLSPRSRMDLAVVGVAAFAKVEKGAFKDIRIGLGAVAPTPIRAREAEKRLMGEPASESVISEAAALAAKEAKPIDDHRASAEYRRMMVEVLVKRAVHQAIAN
ncbi:MAG: FAD binding domain-containing protein [Deltaproteobacteria bacterium]|nr:FAD binding domain-containing protein [Deltaproteobacteria bacterium]